MDDEAIEPRPPERHVASPRAEPACGGPAAFEWRVHPALEQPAAALVACVVIVAMGLVIHQAFGGTAWAVFAAVAMCLALQRFFFSSVFRIDAAGVSATSLMSRRRLAWDEVRRVVYGSRAAWLSPFTRRSLAESRRGVHLLFGRHRADVLAHLRRFVPAERLLHTSDGRVR